MMLETTRRIVCVGVCLSFWGCAKTESSAAQSPPAEDTPVADPLPPPALDEEDDDEQKAQKQSVPEPEFREGMSVLEATNAIPQGIERLNVEQERLSEPLMNPELYEPCKLAASQRFQIKVAVWNGKAVGIDLSTKPTNEAAERCLREQVSSITWPDKVKSLNTVEFNY